MHVTEPSAATPTELKATARAMRYLLFIAGMGGLLYGIDVGIIAGALPYLEATASVAWHLSAQQLSASSSPPYCSVPCCPRCSPVRWPI
jgi:hypothetical protein